jgi:hypothetical protein
MIVVMMAGFLTTPPCPDLLELELEGPLLVVVLGHDAQLPLAREREALLQHHVLCTSRTQTSSMISAPHGPLPCIPAVHAKPILQSDDFSPSSCTV